MIERVEVAKKYSLRGNEFVTRIIAKRRSSTEFCIAKIPGHSEYCLNTSFWNFELAKNQRNGTIKDGHGGRIRNERISFSLLLDSRIWKIAQFAIDEVADSRNWKAG